MESNTAPPDGRSVEPLQWPSGQRSGLLPALQRRAMAMVVQGAARKGRTVLVLEYPTSADPGPRHGHGKPAHSQLNRLLEAGRDRYRDNLDAIRALLGQIADVPRSAGGDERSPCWDNEWLSGLDAAALYYFLVTRRPSHYIEIGSGMSTRWARLAIERQALDTTITSIDPRPREEVEDLCDAIIRQPLERTDLERFKTLRAGDVVFMDGSHRSFTNSDATVFLLDVVPDLPPGVLVGIHDVLLPADYPPDWTGRFYSEQYLLAAYLLGGAAGIRIELPCYFAAVDRELGAAWSTDWRGAGLDGLPSQGQAFWFTTI